MEPSGIAVANDGMEQFLLRNERGAAFREVAIEAGVALSDDARTYAGMGVSFADYNNDGRADLVITNLALEKYALYRNEGDGSFKYWYDGHLGFFQRQCAAWGKEWHMDAPCVCESFDLIYKP